MNLTIDFGNTTSKVAVFEKHSLVDYKEHLCLDELYAYIYTVEPSCIIVADVGRNNDEWLNSLRSDFTILNLSHETPIPIFNYYKTPHTLGMDRLAAVVGANYMFPEQHNLVIDCGTCITYDFINVNKEYYGGGISMGMKMRFKALNQFTARLPLVTFNPAQDAHLLIGQSTQEAIISGVVNGVIAELEGIIQQYQKLYADFNIIICGGDADFFDTKINHSIFVSQSLVLYGLNRILDFNTNEK